MTKDEAYDFLYTLGRTIARMFGSSCEVIIHDMSGAYMENLAIFNGHVSGRTEGSRLSIYGNETELRSEENVDLNSDICNQIVILPNGKTIKSSTVHFRGEDFHYALGINYDITVLGQMQHLLSSITAAEGELYESLSNSGEVRIDTLFDAAMEIINKPVGQMKKADRIALVRILKENGAFELQRSVPYVAEKLGVTKFTVYNYINELGE